LLKGDTVKFAFHRGKIVITPTVLIDRSKFPAADDEYTPAQRRIIDARLAESEADYKAGRSYGPFHRRPDDRRHESKAQEGRRHEETKTFAMKVDYLARAHKALQDAPEPVRRASFKQVSLLVNNLSHPSLHAKKYDELRDHVFDS
jgi:hypothetical protein